jgi:hypothetical protein
LSGAAFAVGLVVEDSRNYPGDAVVRMFVTFVFISIIIRKVVKNPSVFLVAPKRSFAALRMTAYEALVLIIAQIARILRVNFLWMRFVVLVSQPLLVLAALL